MTRASDSRAWTDIEIELVRTNYPDYTTVALARALGRTRAQIYQKAASLGLKKSKEYLASPAACRLRRGDAVGCATRFQPGQEPANKGLRRPGWAPGRMSQTQFKKGAMSGAARQKYVPVGSLRVTCYGALEVKTTDDPDLYPARRWRPVAHLVWEAAHGQIPPGYIVRFKSGMHTVTREEITVDCLECISRVENMRRNSIQNYPESLKRAVLMRGALNRRIRYAEEHQ